MKSTNALREPIAVQVLKRALKNPETMAITTGSTQCSYAQLADRSIQFSNHCNREVAHQNQLIQKNSVALCMHDPIGLLSAFIGARLCGHNVLVLNPEWPKTTLKQCLDQLQPSLCLYDKTLDHDSAESLPAQEPLRDSISAWIKGADRDLQSAFYTGFTSGSEGAPKGFSRHEDSWLHSFEIDAQSYELTDKDTVVCPGKLAHSLFLYACLRGLTTGAPVLIVEGLAQAASRALLRQHRSVALFAVPAQLRSLSESSQIFDHIRLLISAGAKLPSTQREALQNALPHADIMECYGSSELSYIALAKPADDPPADSVGRPCDGVEVRIANANGQAVEPGEPGKILVRSPLRFIGYAEAHNQTSLRQMQYMDGFLDSGDTGYLDQNGFLFITGRSDRMMLIAGHSLFPEQIESALMTHPLITRAAVFPIEDRLRGQRAVAVIDGETISRRQLLSHAASTLPHYAIPRRYYRTSHWPLTVSEKTDLKQLITQHELKQLEPVQ